MTILVNIKSRVVQTNIVPEFRICQLCLDPGISEHHPTPVSQHHDRILADRASDLLRSPDLKKAIGDPITKKKNAMCDLRGRIQGRIDAFEVSWLSIRLDVWSS